MGFLFCGFVVVLSFLIFLLQLPEMIYHYGNKILEGILCTENQDGNLIQTPSKLLWQILLYNFSLILNLADILDGDITLVIFTTYTSIE